MPELSSLTDAATEILVERGPMTPEALLMALTRRGFDLGAEPEDLLFDEVLETEGGEFMPLVDDRWCHLPSLLMGRVFTHRATPTEIEHDVLAVANLEPILMLSDTPAYGRLADGSPLPVAFPDSASPELDRSVPPEALDSSGSLLLPAGRLGGLGVPDGDLVGLRLTPDGLELVRVDRARDPEDTSDLRTLAVRLLQAVPSRPKAAETLVWTLLAEDPTAFVEPLPPLGELLAAWDLPTHGVLVGVPGFDFPKWQAEGRLARLRQRYELSAEEALGVAALVRLHESVLDVLHAYSSAQESGSTAELEQIYEGVRSAAAESPLPGLERDGRTVGAALRLLAEPAVAEAAFRETGAGDATAATALILLVEALQPQVDRGARPALHWLRANASMELGETAAAEQALRAAEQLDPAWPPTVIDLARFAGDRGDAAAGLALLRRLDDDVAPPLLGEVLERFRPAPARMMPRNEPCWCGSGRKFKQCHLRQTDRLPLPERATWLYQKAVLHVLSTSWIGLANELGHLRAAYADTEREVRERVDDGLVLDAALFEGGALADFVETRGTLLPDDELLLAQQWMLTERSVFEVTAVTPGALVTLRDVRTGDVTEVRERTASRQLKPGHLLCSHLLSTGDGLGLFGGVEPVGLHDRDALIELLDGEPDPEDVVEFLTRRFAPPTLANTEGDPLVLGKAELHTDDPAALTAALDRVYRREEVPDDPAVAEWVEIRTIDGLDRLTASLRLEGTTLVVTANSEPRLDGALATVRRLQPSLVLRSEERLPMGDLRQAARLAETLPSTAQQASADLNDLPEVRAALAQHMRAYEEQWLDLPVPALAGRTPREAADDPTRRDDLVRLLASFPETNEATAMSPARLRAALGLAAG
ncbi:MAG: SEC-C domain-containing protein [Actinomycetes bacterium]